MRAMRHRTRRMRLRSRIGILVGSVALAAGAVWLLAGGDEPTLDFRWGVHAEAVAPGDIITIANVADECAPSPPIWYQRSQEGDWRQTHVDQLESTTGPASVTTACGAGPFDVTVPPTVEPGSVLAMCSPAGICLEVATLP